jgi:transcriptional regulator with PAS, ATPase and Fis domain
MAKRAPVDVAVAADVARAYYVAGRLSDAIDHIDKSGVAGVSDRLVLAVALFDQGDVTRCLEVFSELSVAVLDAAPQSRFEVEFLRFQSASAFLSPSDTTSLLAPLRQLATSLGDSSSLAGLHLAVAKLESLRGSMTDAGTHVEIARRLACESGLAAIQTRVDLISTNIDVYSGNIERATRSSIRGFEISTNSQHKRPTVSSLANLGSLALYSGNASVSRRFLEEARTMAGELSFVQLALADSLTNLALYEGRLSECSTYLAEAQRLIGGQRVPARSLYDFLNQITRCLYLSHLGDWQGIVDVVDAAHQELERRQLRVWQASLLSAKAKAQAHLGLHDAADATLLQAFRLCPRGAVDPLITVEAATGTCLALRGDRDRGARHFERALRACQAISHRFQEWAVTIERDRVLVPGRTTPAVERRRASDTEDTNLILSDVSTMLGASHSVDVMAQRLTAIISTTALRSRLDVRIEDVDSPELTNPVRWDTESDGTHRIVLADSTRRAVLQISQVHGLEDVSLVRNLVDLAKSAVSQRGGSQRLDEELLWPQVALPNNTDAVFWSPRMQEFVRVALRLAETPLPILITGETGTGKEVIARLIHANSKNARGPFVPFNASALSKDLVESQLFGYRRGAFTGAVETSGGVIRAAENGTLFLDEIGDLDLHLQPKLLRFLESGEIHPLGEGRPVQTRVRVVAATNADLRGLVATGRFRNDLFYRLNTATLTLPPLRDRKDEIPAMAALYVRKASKESGRQDLKVADDFTASLLMYDWPGNIRQLANEIRRVVALAEDGDTLTAHHLSPEIALSWTTRRAAVAPREDGPTVTVRVDQPLERAIDDVERVFLERALSQTRGHVSDAARLLGISRKGLFLKRKKLGLE